MGLRIVAINICCMLFWCMCVCMCVLCLSHSIMGLLCEFFGRIIAAKISSREKTDFFFLLSSHDVILCVCVYRNSPFYISHWEDAKPTCNLEHALSIHKSSLDIIWIGGTHIEYTYIRRLFIRFVSFWFGKKQQKTNIVQILAYVR